MVVSERHEHFSKAGAQDYKLAVWGQERPKKREECENKEFLLPCPFVGCKHNLYLDVTDSGSLKMPDYEPWEADPKSSCILEIVDREGPLTLERVGELMEITRERVRQIEARAMSKLARAMKPGDKTPTGELLGKIGALEELRRRLNANSIG